MLVENKLRKANLIRGEWHIGKIDSIINPYSANVFVDGSTTSQKVPTNPNINFVAGEQVLVVFLNGDSKNKYVIAKCATGTETTG